MSIRLIVTDDPNNGSDRVALYDSVTGWAFGPVFADAESAEAFLEWTPEDARSYTVEQLSVAYSLWLRERSEVPA